MKKLDRILLIDDDIPTNFYNKKIIELVGCANHVETCTSAQQGLDYLNSKTEDGTHPQPELIFLDINMPVMTGWDFLDEYEKLPEDIKGQIIVVMLTTSMNPDDEERAAERKIGGYSKKPLSEEELRKIIQEHFS